MVVTRAGVARVFYQELKEGDRRKIQASSNDAPSGGGARDLRIPEEAFGEFFERLLPGTASRRSNRRMVQVRMGNVKWPQNETEFEEHVLEIWPPTSRRPLELRIAQVNRNFPSSVPAGRAFVLVIQDTDGEIWGHYTTEKELRTGDWDERVRASIVACIDSTRPTRSVRGFVDFETGRSHCHG